MSSTILTLFGEEIVPEQIKAVGKSRSVSKKKKEEISPVKKVKREKKEPTTKPDILADWKADKQYYSIGEVASLFHVNTSHIRFWTKEFELKVRTTRKGDRLYTPDQIRELRAIYNLVKERGFTINGAKAKLKSNKRKAVETVDLKQSLLQLRNKLLSIRNQIS
jgi:DNA-binding transcriptional MerR regulator